jgi:hypothetical protein
MLQDRLADRIKLVVRKDTKPMPAFALLVGKGLFDAVDKQLGLKLDVQKLPLPVLVVDIVNQKPTPNALEVVEQMPPPRHRVLCVSVVA